MVGGSCNVNKVRVLDVRLIKKETHLKRKREEEGVVEVEDEFIDPVRYESWSPHSIVSRL